MLTLGIDPDSKDLAIGYWDHTGPRTARVIHVTGKASAYEMMQALSNASPLQWVGTGPQIIAIEGQQVDKRRTGKGDLFKLAHVTGAAYLWVVQQRTGGRILVPTPADWKRGVAKHAHQARLYDELGWGYEIVGAKSAKSDSRYARPLRAPSNFSHIEPGQWKHVGDALLLARWAQTQG